MQIVLHIEFKLDEDAERCAILAKIRSYLLRNRTPYSKKTEGASFDGAPAFNRGNRNSTERDQFLIRKFEPESSIVLKSAKFLIK